MMTVETFVLGIDARFPECRIYILIFNRRSVLVKKLANQNTVSTVYFGRLIRAGILYLGESWRFSEKPEKVQIHHTQIYDERNYA